MTKNDQKKKKKKWQGYRNSVANHSGPRFDLALPLISSICFGEISQFSQFVIIQKFLQSADHLKAEKIWVTKTRAVSSLFAILCVLPLSQIWSYDHFFFQQALGRAQIYV